MAIYQHFREHEHPFIDQVLSWTKQVERTFTHVVTDFLDPREQQIIATIIGTNNEEIVYQFFGGINSAERKRAIIAPYYTVIEEEHFETVLLEASFPDKFVNIAHRDILGAFTSLGIDRKKIGDIVVGDGIFQFYTTEELKPYVKMNLTTVKKATIQLQQIPFENAIDKNENWQQKTITASSLRLDNMIKEIYNVSRKDATLLINRNLVKVNFTHIDNPAVQLMEDDLISVRGYGRSKITEINGLTRKEKIRITVARLTL